MQTAGKFSLHSTLRSVRPLSCFGSEAGLTDLARTNPDLLPLLLDKHQMDPQKIQEMIEQLRLVQHSIQLRQQQEHFRQQQQQQIKVSRISRVLTSTGCSGLTVIIIILKVLGCVHRDDLLPMKFVTSSDCVCSCITWAL